MCKAFSGERLETVLSDGVGISPEILESLLRMSPMTP